MGGERVKAMEGRKARGNKGNVMVKVCEETDQEVSRMGRGGGRECRLG